MMWERGFLIGNNGFPTVENIQKCVTGNDGFLNVDIATFLPAIISNFFQKNAKV